MSLIVALAGLLAERVQTTECRFEHMDNSAISVPVVGPGLSTVGEDAPVGKVLYKGLKPNRTKTYVKYVF